MEKIANDLARRCIQLGAAKSENLDILEYGIFQILFFISNYILIQLAAIFFNKSILAIIYTIVYLSIVQLTGSYHAKTPLRCSIKTFLVFITFMFLLNIIPEKIYVVVAFFILVTSSTIVFMVTPVRHKNKTWSKSQIINNRKKALCMIFFFFFLYVLFQINGYAKVGFAIVLTVQVTSCMALLGFLFNEK